MCGASSHAHIWLSGGRRAGLVTVAIAHALPQESAAEKSLKLARSGPVAGQRLAESPVGINKRAIDDVSLKP